MAKLQLDASIKESKDMVLKAFEQTDGINQYRESKYQIVGKTGVSFPRVLWSYGESVYVDFSETRFSKTEIEVSAEKEISVNIGSNPQKFMRRFLNELDNVRNSPIDNESESSGGWGNKKDIDDPIPTAKTEKQAASRPESYNITKVSDGSMSSGKKTAITAVIVVLIFMSLMFIAIL